MNKVKHPVPILVVDDDIEDLEMIVEALQESRLLNKVFCVKDGEEAMDYLQHRGRFSDQTLFPLPGLILLDLNMPRKGGRETLEEIKNDPGLRHIPVIVLTTSKAEEDIFQTYNTGVNSFITKPVSFSALVQVMKGLGKYWFELVELPGPAHAE
jgi:CheY-like chemotaxis protein